MALWPLLLSEGGQWREVVLEAIRKLPAEYLSSDVFDALEGMLSPDDDRILRKVLDTCKTPRIVRAAPQSLIERIIKLTKGETESTARRALAVISSLEATQALPVLIQALSHPGQAVRMSAIRALVGFGEQAVEPLVASLKDGQSVVQRGVVSVLGKLENEKVMESLVVALKDSDPEIQRSAVEALENLRNRKAAKARLTVCRDNQHDAGQPARVEMESTTLASPRVRSVRVKGLGDLQTRLAQCCKPTPDDPMPIVGYLTRQGEVTIHRWDCPNIRARTRRGRSSC